MRRTLAAVLGASAVLVSATTGPSAAAQVSPPTVVHGSQELEFLIDTLRPVVPELRTLSSVVGSPAPDNARGLDGCVGRFLVNQGYTVVHAGTPYDRALDLAQRGYEGDLALNGQGVSRAVYFADGEGIVSRVKAEHASSTCHWYMAQHPTRVSNAKRAAVATWGASGGDVYIGQFFTYH